MDTLSILLPALLAVTGILSSVLFKYFEQGLAWINALTPGKKQLVFVGFTLLVTLARKFIPGIPIPDDPSQWDATVIEGIVSALIGMGVFALGKRTTKAPVRLTSTKAGAR